MFCAPCFFAVACTGLSDSNIKWSSVNVIFFTIYINLTIKYFYKIYIKLFSIKHKYLSKPVCVFFLGSFIY